MVELMIEFYHRSLDLRCFMLSSLRREHLTKKAGVPNEWKPNRKLSLKSNLEGLPKQPNKEATRAGTGPNPAQISQPTTLRSSRLPLARKDHCPPELPRLSHRKSLSLLSKVRMGKGSFGRLQSPVHARTHNFRPEAQQRTVSLP